MPARRRRKKQNQAPVQNSDYSSEDEKDSQIEVDRSEAKANPQRKQLLVLSGTAQNVEKAKLMLWLLVVMTRMLMNLAFTEVKRNTPTKSKQRQQTISAGLKIVIVKGRLLRPLSVGKTGQKQKRLKSLN